LPSELITGQSAVGGGKSAPGGFVAAVEVSSPPELVAPAVSGAVDELAAEGLADCTADDVASGTAEAAAALADDDEEAAGTAVSGGAVETAVPSADTAGGVVVAAGWGVVPFATEAAVVESPPWDAISASIASASEFLLSFLKTSP